MELSESEETKDANSSGIKFVHTSDSNNEGNFGLWGNVNLTILFGIPAGFNFSAN